ncbi:Alkaline phosphatase synthesis transcriptional regulatory protein SphR [Aquisphaera giovannonii]|uniref:Alkaline phosphatase synthesis transcriptional regulatory protein SphR n=1 Tax=Aquisphaera giovannonii TaxID=406548 RepID=A0A5B9VZN8_9BACT|nr:response regulator transcription factor [Aquisphaera giovannonii]QEH33414.1 Alkaline phosphatase synthesis transcriptional regulatory protein SphR [Aquisphaera giovannonii]
MEFGPPPRILLVEDEALLRRLVAQFLRGDGFDVVEAADGLLAVELFESEGPFDMVLLDLNLPGLPGVEVCRRIRKVEPSQPVMICSAAILDSHVESLTALGVQQFLTKPYHPEELLRRISVLLDGPDRAPGAAPPHRTPHSLRRPRAASHVLSNRDAID